MSDEKRCTHVDSCELFPLISRPGFLRVWQINYCENDYRRCQRFKMAGEGKAVPVTMMPNGQMLTALDPKKAG